jgi:hypothetical protein
VPDPARASPGGIPGSGIEGSRIGLRTVNKGLIHPEMADRLAVAVSAYSIFISGSGELSGTICPPRWYISGPGPQKPFSSRERSAGRASATAMPSRSVQGQGRPCDRMGVEGSAVK